jgi:16S rRNA (cytosine1402-N4)-methyltransferase
MNATMSLEKIKHYPVMLDQILSIISPQRGGTFIDCTFGGGGYSKAILNYPDTKVFALDRDQSINKYAEKLKIKFPKRFSFFQNKFSDLNKIINLDLKPRAIIFDLGLSTFQLNDQKRGFSFKSKESLSMEMGINKYSAYDVVNTLDIKNLAKIIKVYGDEKDGKKIANKIIQQRNKSPIKNSLELANIINETKKNYKKFKKNPATKTFQAIRIFVNQELTELVNGLIDATKLLAEGGMLIVVSFHSLEDKIVKNFFTSYSNLKRNTSRYLPLESSKFSLFNLKSKKPLTPNKKEINENINSRSAKLRFGTRNSNSFFYPTEFKNNFIDYFEMGEIKL